jgi:hypothetical protein
LSSRLFVDFLGKQLQQMSPALAFGRIFQEFLQAFWYFFTPLQVSLICAQSALAASKRLRACRHKMGKIDLAQFRDRAVALGYW